MSRIDNAHRARRPCPARLQNTEWQDVAPNPESPAPAYAKPELRSGEGRPESSPPKRPKAAGNGAAAPSGHLPAAGAMQLLATAVTHWPVRFTWGQLATLNGRKARGGHFNTSKKFLAAHGLVVERDGKVEPTDAAFQKIGKLRKETPATRDAMLAMWVAALPSPAAATLSSATRRRVLSSARLFSKASPFAVAV
jgi:hypothetical protein